MISPFRSVPEFRRVTDLYFATLSRDPKAGPALYALDKPQRWVFSDFGLSLTVGPARKPARAKGDNLEWTWETKGCPWEPAVVLEVTSAIANGFFQGKVNVPLAILRGDIQVTGGKTEAALEAIPHVHHLARTWTQRLRHEGWDHLLA